MRAFIAPSILLSIAKRSSKGLTQHLGVLTADNLGASARVTPVFSCDMSSGGDSAGASAISSATWPLGLDPDNCKVVDIRQQLRSRGYTAPSKGQTKATLLEELRGLVRAEGFAPPDATLRLRFSDLATHRGRPAGPYDIGPAIIAARRWSPDAGWVDRSAMEKGEKGFPLCRFCNEEVSSARRTFCSNGCIHEHRIRTQGSYVRKCLLTRDGGKCSVCGIDAAGHYKRARAAWMSGTSLASKRQTVAKEMVGTPFEGKVLSEGATRRPPQGKFWHADHIIPVVRGGGQCSLKNYRTLCVPCHATATKTLAGERAAERARAAGAAAAGRPYSTSSASASPAGAGSAAAKGGRKKRGRPRAIGLVVDLVDSASSSCDSGSDGLGEVVHSKGIINDDSVVSLSEAFSSEAVGGRKTAGGASGVAGRRKRQQQQQGLFLGTEEQTTGLAGSGRWQEM
ncbi:unnamed protein product [Scytosiphon promiscuus]